MKTAPLLRSLAALFGISLVAGCAATGPRSTLPVVKDTTPVAFEVGGVPITDAALDGAELVYFSWPGAADIFPGNRGDVRLAVETKALYGSAKDSIAIDSLKKSPEWYLLSLFFPGQLYLKQVLAPSLGIPDSVLHKRYKADIARYTTMQRGDSVGKTDTIIKSFEEVRTQVALECAVSYYPPDSSWFARFTRSDSSGSRIDSAAALRRWGENVQKSIPLFLLKDRYRAAYGVPYPDSISAVYGEGKLVAPAHVDAILSWLPPEALAQFQAPERRRELIDWIVRWDLFSREARIVGFTSRPDIAAAMEWAWEVQVVRAYLHSRVMPTIAATTPVDTLMSLYSYWEKAGRPGVRPDSATLARVIDTDLKTMVTVGAEKVIYSARNRAGVKFIRANITDGREATPDSLSRLADTLYAGGIYQQANDVYKKLLDLYPFSSQGVDACIELAKLATEREEYAKAADYYRKYLRFSTDLSRRCNVFFMLGFIYGEHLNRTELADACYKWILRYAPDCDLADDAEFMCQHIGEPMSGVEELQAEARRQGRVVPADEAPAETK